MPGIGGLFSTGCKVTFLHIDLFIQKRGEKDRPFSEDVSQHGRRRPECQGKQKEIPMQKHPCIDMSTSYPTAVVLQLEAVMSLLTPTVLECALAGLHFLTHVFYHEYWKGRCVVCLLGRWATACRMLLAGKFNCINCSAVSDDFRIGMFSFQLINLFWYLYRAIKCGRKVLTYLRS